MRSSINTHTMLTDTPQSFSASKLKTATESILFSFAYAPMVFEVNQCCETVPLYANRVHRIKMKIAHHLLMPRMPMAHSQALIRCATQNWTAFISVRKIQFVLNNFPKSKVRMSDEFGPISKAYAQRHREKLYFRFGRTAWPNMWVTRSCHRSFFSIYKTKRFFFSCVV